jgi:ferritin-like metal-binding protein YciE
MVKNATAEALKTAFEEHLRETEAHVERLEHVFEMLELAAREKK